MKEGFYSITYTGETGDWGLGIIVLDTGIVIGVDAAGGRYDGTYVFNPKTDLLEASIKMTVPPGVTLVQGVPSRDKEWSFEFAAAFPRETSETPVLVQTPFGWVNVFFRYLRGFPG